MKMQRNIRGPVRQKGATLLEITMVIGIIALISIAAVVSYNSATEGRRISEATKSLGQMVGGIRNLFGAQGDFVGLSNNVVIKAGFLPKEMFDGVTIHHPWADNAVTFAPTGTTNREFTVTYTGVPQEACVSLAGTTIGNAVTLTIGGAAVTNVGLITGSCADNVTMVWTFN